MTVQVPARSVFFIVLPRAGARACLTPDDLTIKEELVNPQWEQWRNMKSLINTGELQGDLIFERGGVYEGHDIQNNVEALKSELVISKNNVKTVRGKVKQNDILGKHQSTENVNNKLENISGNSLVTDVLKTKQSDDVLQKTEGIKEDDVNTNIENTLIDRNNKNKTMTSALHRKIIFTQDEKRKLENLRVKRSDVLSHSRKNTNHIPQVDNTHLNKNLDHLQRIKAIDSTNSGLKSSSLRTFKPIFQTNETVPKKLFFLSKETEMNKNHIQNENLLNLNETIQKNNASTQLVNSTRVDENYHYHPGSFYETLGNIKINSNLSLADIKEQHDAFALMFKESATCENCKSILNVTKRPANQEESDRKIVESQTKYLKNTEDLNKFKKFADTEVEKDGSSVATSWKNLSSEKPVIIERIAKNISLETIERKKRDTESYKYISQIFNKNALQELGDSNSTNMSRPEEMKLRMFLQELTEEGEELLNSYDDEYELNKPNNNSKQDRFAFPVLFPVLNKHSERNDIKQTSTVDEGSSSDFYTKNNLIRNITNKPKRKYNSTVDMDFLSNSKNISNTYTVQNVNPGKSNDAELNLLKDTVIDDEKLQTNTPLKLNELNSIERIHEINQYSKFTSLDKTTSKPKNTNSFFYSLTPKPFHNLFKSYESSEQIKKSNSEEINNFETTIKPQNVLKPFKQEGIILPTEKDFTTLKLDDLDNSSIENSTGNNLNLKLVLPNNNVSKSNETNSYLPVKSRLFQQPFKNYNNFKVDQDPVFEKPTSPESTMSLSLNNEKYFQGEAKTSPKQTYRNLDDKRDTDVKESMIISAISASPMIQSSFLKTGTLKSEFNGQKEKPNELKHFALNITTQDDASNNFLQENKSTNKPNYLKNTQQLNNLNKTPGLLKSIKEINSPLTIMLLKKQKERFKAIQERLEKARERFANIRNIHSTPNAPTIKLSNALHNNFIDDLKRNSNMQTEEILKTPKQHDFVGVESKISVKKQLHSDDVPPPYDSGLFTRRKRQTSNLDGEDQDLTKINSVTLETLSSILMTNNESSDIVIESSYTPIHKWIIPLSNHTEQIVMKNKIFPVKLFGVLSDDWQNQQNKKDVILKESERNPRSVQYSCMRDHFDDYSEEDKNDDSIKVEKDIKTVAHQNQQLMEKPAGKKLTLVSTPIYSHRKRRSVRNKAKINDFDIQSLFTNEIKKERPISKETIIEDVSDDISDHDRNNTFISMLRKEVAEIMKNKTGGNRMFELAKLYQKTDPKSLETFKTEEKFIQKETIIEDVSDDISDHEQNSTFTSMLRKEVAEIMKNKTGVNRMFELAKLYQKTDPKSLEIFKNEEKVIQNTTFEAENSEEKNKALEVLDSTETVNLTIPERSRQNELEILFRTLNGTNENEQTSRQHKTSMSTAETNKFSEGSDSSNKNIFSIFMINIKDFLKTAHTVFTNFFNKIKPLKPTST